MKTTTSFTETLHITDAPGLDPIDVFLQEFGPGIGRITIRCYASVWAGYWGAMGTDLRRFFVSCHPEYIAGNLRCGQSPGLKKNEKRDDEYLFRVIVAVQEALREQPEADDPAVNDYYHGPIWLSFGLTRASYAVFPRRALQSMPRAWQETFVALIDKAHDTLADGVFGGDYTVLQRKRGRFATDPMADYRHTGPVPMKEPPQ